MTEWLEYSHDWGSWINPDTFRTPKIKKSVKVGSVVFLKAWENLDDGRRIVVTTYGVAGETGIKEMGKKEVSKVLASQMLDFMRASGMHPPKTEIKKSYVNGNVDLDYSPTDFDSFTIRLTPELVGGNVEDFLYSLDAFKEEEPEIDEPWMVEPAKSSRSTCRTCSQTIQKDEIRLGEPNIYEGHVTYRWHHLKCAAGRITGVAFDTLTGYEELTDEQKKELQDVI